MRLLLVHNRGVERGLTALPPALPEIQTIRNKGCRRLKPASRRVRCSFILPNCLPTDVVGQTKVRETRCAKSLHCNAQSAKTVTTRRPRTRRPPPGVSSSRSSAIRAVSTRTTRKPSKSSFRLAIGSRKLPGGVSSTVKLSVSKTELLGSNPSSPASFVAPALPA